MWTRAGTCGMRAGRCGRIHAGVCSVQGAAWASGHAFHAIRGVYPFCVGACICACICVHAGIHAGMHFLVWRPALHMYNYPRLSCRGHCMDKGGVCYNMQCMPPHQEMHTSMYASMYTNARTYAGTHTEFTHPYCMNACPEAHAAPCKHAHPSMDASTLPALIHRSLPLSTYPCALIHTHVPVSHLCCTHIHNAQPHIRSMPGVCMHTCSPEGMHTHMYTGRMPEDAGSMHICACTKEPMLPHLHITCALICLDALSPCTWSTGAEGLHVMC